MHSTSKVVDRDGQIFDKSWPAERWLSVAREVNSWGRFDVIAIGSESDPQLHSPYFRNLYGLPIKTVAALLQNAACVIAVESGVTHLCHAVDAPMVVIFSKHVPLAWANPREASRASILYDDPLALSCDDLLRTVEWFLRDHVPYGHTSMKAAVSSMS
jgi:ADP-heptose:LPS heptosyltransferase